MLQNRFDLFGLQMYIQGIDCSEIGLEKVLDEHLTVDVSDENVVHNFSYFVQFGQNKTILKRFFFFNQFKYDVDDNIHASFPVGFLVRDIVFSE